MLKKTGFTLIEILVVVLIIGILAAIALPQYRKVVEKAKLSEALTNYFHIKKAIDMYILQHDYPSTIGEYIYLEDLGVELSGGKYDNKEYQTKNYLYAASIVRLSNTRVGSTIDVIPKSSSYYQLIYDDGTFNEKNECFDGDNEIGKYICHYLESQGWEYNEGVY